MHLNFCFQIVNSPAGEGISKKGSNSLEEKTHLRNVLDPFGGDGSRHGVLH